MVIKRKYLVRTLMAVAKLTDSNKQMSMVTFYQDFLEAVVICVRLKLVMKFDLVCL